MENGIEKQPVTISRNELYEEVWKTPMSRLAESYGLSGNGLAKICHRLKIPYPPRGYWAKKAAGKNVIRFRLPEPDENTPLFVDINPTPPPSPPPDLPPESQQKIDTVQRQADALVVPERLTRPHPIIAGWLAQHEQRRKDAKRERDPLMRRLSAVADWTEMDRRRHRVLDTLFKSLESQGVVIKTGERTQVYLEADGERIDFKLRERLKQIKRPLTLDEKRWLHPGDKDWRQELEPTGDLVFTIDTYLRERGIRKKWEDRPGKLVEGQIADIVANILMAGPALAQWQREREEEARKREENAERRRLEAERRKKDRNQWQRFLDLASQWKETQAAQEFLHALEQHATSSEGSVGDRTADEWIAWAREWLQRYDPVVNGPHAVFKDISQVTAWTNRE